MNITLDGVIQAPGRADEDPRGGFKHGGWAAPYNAMQDGGESISSIGALLLGRVTYEAMYDFWPKQVGNPMTEMLSNMPKYVASTTLQEPLPWENSTLLSEDIAATVDELKTSSDRDIVIFGSGELCQLLMERNVIDEYVLLVHPLVLGSGRKLFEEGSAADVLELLSTKTTPAGVVISTYQPMAK